MAEEDFITQMEECMMENGDKEEWKDWEPYIILQEGQLMQDSGTMINLMGILNIFNFQKRNSF